MGIGALLIFLGVALFSARAARPLAALVSPVATWGVVVLVVLFWPFFTLPFWLLRLGAWGPGQPLATGGRPRSSASFSILFWR